ncbi:MAG: thiamine phosphate synthase [Methylomicrobium sp.]
MNLPKRGLYAITQTDGKTMDQVVEEVSAAIRGGAVMVQYRDKQPLDALRLGQALLDLCRDAEVPLIVNDDIDLAATIGADGVHLGRDDDSIDYAKQRLGQQAIIGISCYDSLDRALIAERQGATYVAFGRFFPSGTKPLASPARLATLREAKRSLTIPTVAIGGILPSNGRQLIDAGADLLAVVGGVFDHDPESSARALQALFD